MLVFWEQRLVFLATPKTGSTAIETALESLAAVSILRPPALKHTPVGRYRRFLAPYLEKTAGETFTVVALMREPVSWLGSWYRYRQRDDIADERKSTQGKSFDEFVTGYLARPRPGFADVGGQARFLLGPDGRPVDHIFCYEDMAAFVTFLEDRLGHDIVLPRVNVSPEGETDLNPALDQALRRACAEEFDLYARVLADGTAAQAALA